MGAEAGVSFGRAQDRLSTSQTLVGMTQREDEEMLAVFLSPRFVSSYSNCDISRRLEEADYPD